MRERREDSRDFGSADLVVDRGADDLRLEAEDVLLQPRLVDLLDRRTDEPSARLFAGDEVEDEHRDGDDEEERDAPRDGARGTVRNGDRRTRAVELQRRVDDIALPRLQVRDAGVVRRADTAPDRVDGEMEREVLDDLARLPVAEREVVREEIALVHPLDDAAVRVAEPVCQLGVLELQIGGEPGTPADLLAVGHLIVIDFVDRAHEERRLRAVAVDPRQLLEVERLVAVDVERPLAAVPVAVEDVRLRLDDVHSPLGVEMGIDGDGAPVKRLRVRGCCEEQRQEQDRSNSHGWLSTSEPILQSAS